MNAELDPFSHHPELRDMIVDPMQSDFRGFNISKMVPELQARGLPINWWYSDDVREALRTKALNYCRDDDLWVFGYGSLMWDPGFRFEEIRRAHAPDYARHFILKDIHGARGSPDNPGLMAALDKGTGCDGLLFKIARQHIEQETEILWRREGIAPAYIPTFIETIVAGQSKTALAFVADHDAEPIQADLTRDEQIHLFANGCGFRGTSLEYLQNISSHFAALDIIDEHVIGLLRDTEIYMNSQ